MNLLPLKLHKICLDSMCITVVFKINEGIWIGVELRTWKSTKNKEVFVKKKRWTIICIRRIQMHLGEQQTIYLLNSSLWKKKTQFIY